MMSLMLLPILVLFVSASAIKRYQINQGLSILNLTVENSVACAVLNEDHCVWSTPKTRNTGLGESWKNQTLELATDGPSEIIYYTLTTLQSQLGFAPLDWDLYGTNNLNLYYLLDTRDDFRGWELDGSATFTVQIPRKCRYYRLIVTEVEGEDGFKAVVLDKIVFEGVSDEVSSAPTVSVLPTRNPTGIIILGVTDRTVSVSSATVGFGMLAFVLAIVVFGIGISRYKRRIAEKELAVNTMMRVKPMDRVSGPIQLENQPFVHFHP